MDKQNAKVHNAYFYKTEVSLLSILCVVLLCFQGKTGRDLYCTKDKEVVATAPGAKHCILSLSKPFLKSVSFASLENCQTFSEADII